MKGFSFSLLATHRPHQSLDKTHKLTTVIQDNKLSEQAVGDFQRPPALWKVPCLGVCFWRPRCSLLLATLFPSLPADNSFWSVLKAFYSTRQCPTCCHLLSQPTVHLRLWHRLQLELVKYLLGGLKVEIFCSLWPVIGMKPARQLIPYGMRGKTKRC